MSTAAATTDSKHSITSSDTGAVHVANQAKAQWESRNQRIYFLFTVAVALLILGGCLYGKGHPLPLTVTLMTVGSFVMLVIIAFKRRETNREIEERANAILRVLNLHEKAFYIPTTANPGSYQAGIMELSDREVAQAFDRAAEMIHQHHPERSDTYSLFGEVDVVTGSHVMLAYDRVVACRQAIRAETGIPDATEANPEWEAIMKKGRAAAAQIQIYRRYYYGAADLIRLARTEKLYSYAVANAQCPIVTFDPSKSLKERLQEVVLHINTGGQPTPTPNQRY